MTKVNITETSPSGEVKTYVAEAPGCARDEIDDLGSIMAQRCINDGMGAKEAMDYGAAWSERNAELIAQADALGLEGIANVNWVNAKQAEIASVRSQKREAEVKAQHAAEAQLPLPLQRPQGDVRMEDVCEARIGFERARVLAFWIRGQGREEFDELSDEELRALAAVVGPDCRLLGRYSYELCYPGDADENEHEDRGEARGQ